MHAVVLAAVLAAVPAAPSSTALWDAWPASRVSPADPYTLKHAGLRAKLEELSTAHPALFRVVEEGTSIEGRKIPLLSVGSGPKRVLLWSQMHGDEPTATSALLDVLSHLGKTREDAATRHLLDRLTLLVIPMLNPDGAERNQRRNVQEIDINRDALRLATPEARFLKAVRDEHRPTVGYNLHNQGTLVAAGKGPQAAIALLAVPFDEAFTLDERTRLTRKLAVKVGSLLAPVAEGRVSRYDTDYTPQAFGDSMTRWGTATLLIESGGWGGPGEAERLVRLNFVALLGSLAALADGSVDTVAVGAYEDIPLNRRDGLFHLVVRNGTALGPRIPPTIADLAFFRPTQFAGQGPRRSAASIADVGDLTTSRGLAELDATGLVLVPFATATASWEELRVEVASWSGVRPDAQPPVPLLEETLQDFVDAAVARLRPGFDGAVLLYRRTVSGALELDGAVLRGEVVGRR